MTFLTGPNSTFYGLAVDGVGLVLAVGGTMAAHQSGTINNDFAIARYHAGLEGVYVQQDANYNVTSLVNAAGQVLERYQYTPYGLRTAPNADFTPDSFDSIGP